MSDKPSKHRCVCVFISHYKVAMMLGKDFSVRDDNDSNVRDDSDSNFRDDDGAFKQT